MTVQFTVYGKIRGKSRPRVTRNGTYTPEETEDYENAIAWAYKGAAGNGYYPRGTPVKVRITVFFRLPKSFTKKKKTAAIGGILKPTKKPDGDNVAKIVCDALNGVAWKDDAQVCDLEVVKWWTDGEERLSVELWKVENEGENEVKPNTMTTLEIIDQLESLIDDRKSFLNGEADHDSIYKRDIKALLLAIVALKEKEDK